MTTLIPPQTAEDYIVLVRHLAAITNRAMDYIDSHAPVNQSDLDRSLDRLAQNVETLACLRGDSVIYQETRPDGLFEYQSEMYAIENQLRTRLLSLGYKYPVKH